MVKKVAELLNNAGNVLYMSHLALGDYLYQRTFLSRLKELYPGMTLDIWFDDFRNKTKSWSQGRNQLLTDWLSSEPFVSSHYSIAGSKRERMALIERAGQKHYDVIIIVATSRIRRFIAGAKKIAKNARYIIIEPPRLRYFSRLLPDDKSTLRLPVPPVEHEKSIFSYYRSCFTLLSDKPMPKVLARLSPSSQDKLHAKAWIGNEKRQAGADRAILLNGISTTPKRDYPWNKLKVVLQLISQRFPDVLFIVNTPPHAFDRVNDEVNALKASSSLPITVFSAKSSVHEIAALLGEVDLAVSVETAIIHFAAAMQTPLITLMRRQTALWNPEQATATLFSESSIDTIAAEDVASACIQQLSLQRPMNSSARFGM